MATQTNLKEELYSSYISKKVEEQPDPFLIKTVLRGIGGGSHITNLPSKLEIIPIELNRVLGFLQSHDLIKILNENKSERHALVYATEDGEQYAKVCFDTDYSRWEKITPQETLLIFNQIAPMMDEVTYSKKIGIPLETLDPLRHDIEKKVEALKEYEQKKLLNAIKLPSGSKIRLSFVDSRNPTVVEGYGPHDPHNTTADVNYASIEEAVLDNANQIYLKNYKLDQPFITNEKPLTTYPLIIDAQLHEIRDDNLQTRYAYDISLFHNRFVWDQPAEYNRIGIGKTSDLIKIIDSYVKDQKVNKR